MELNEKILNLRKEHGMTQDSLAEALLVSRQTVYKWETGKALPDVTRLRQICLLFGVSSDELLDVRISAAEQADNAPDQSQEPLEAEAATPTAAGSRTLNLLRDTRSLWLCVCAAVFFCALLVFVLVHVRQPEEVRLAISAGIVPAEMTDELTQPVTERELLALLSNVCEKEAGEACPALAAAEANATKEQMTREKAAYWLYCTHIWTKLDPAAELSICLSEPLIAQRNVYEDLNSLSRQRVDGLAEPWERTLCRELAELGELFEQYDGSTGMDETINTIMFGPYYTSVAFCLAQRCFSNEMPLMESGGGTFRPKDNITMEEAILAVYRLYGSW